MPVGADVGVHVEVVEQHELARQLVQVGRDVFAEQHQRGVAIAFLHVAQHLVVGAVLLHDVDDVLDGRQRAGLVQFGIPVGRVGEGGPGPGLELVAGEGVDPRGRAGLHVGHVPRTPWPGRPGARAPRALVGFGPSGLGYERSPLPFSTTSVPEGSARTAVGYQPAGMNPSTRLRVSETSTTAAALASEQAT